MQVFWANVDQNHQLWLDETETRHCRKVLRHQVGDQINCIDGAGRYYLAIISSFTSDQHTLLAVESSITDWGEHGGNVVLGVSPLRLKDRFEWLIEKSVELGVNKIVPLRCERTDPYKAKFKPERLQTIMRTALKQCKRSRLPELAPLQDFSEWVTQPLSGPRFMAYCEESAHFVQYLTEIPSPPQLTILIGPEGDFTPEEVRQATGSGFTSISLGENRLRTETAAIYALSLVKGWTHN